MALVHIEGLTDKDGNLILPDNYQEILQNFNEASLALQRLIDRLKKRRQEKIKDESAGVNHP